MVADMVVTGATVKRADPVVVVESLVLCIAIFKVLSAATVLLGKAIQEVLLLVVDIHHLVQGVVVEPAAQAARVVLMVWADKAE
jgi:hypothetical protein